MTFHVLPKTQDFLALAAKSSPQRIALISSSLEIPYADLNKRVANFCSQLHGYGIHRGERVAALLDRGLASVILIHALARLGVSLVPLNTRLTVEEMRWQITKSDCAHTISTLKNTPLKEAFHIDNLPPVHPADRWLDGDVNQDDEFGIIFTSGTTGHPKGAILTWGNLFWSAIASAFRSGTLPADRWLLTLPLYHIGGLSIIFRSALYGTTVILPEFPDDKFDEVHLWERMHTSQATLVSLVPTMLYRLLKTQSQWPKSLRLVLLGGAAATSEILEAAKKINLPVAVTYGLTEATSQVATSEPKSTYNKPGSVGKPLMGVKVRIADSSNKHTPNKKQIGEIQVQGPSVMRGYIGQPPVADWLSTGDMGYLDDEGDLFVIQRRSDLIISGGENICPAEIEGVIRQIPAVEDVCVVGLPDAEWGQQVVAAVTLLSESRFDEDVLLAFCQKKLAGYKLPRRIVLLDALPRTNSGKVQRQKLIDLL